MTGSIRARKYRSGSGWKGLFGQFQAAITFAGFFAPSSWASPPKPACELIAVAEVAAVAGVAVTIKPDDAKCPTDDGNPMGGVILGRKDKVVFTVEGSASAGS